MSRRGAYLYKRNGSDKFWLRLVYPIELVALVGRKRMERSLRTSNLVEAEAAASEEIRKHKLALLAAQRAREGKSQPMGLHKRYPPGSTHYENGFTIVALKDDLIFLDQDNRQVRTEPNAIELDLTNTIEFALRDTTRIWLSATTAANAYQISKRDNEEDFDIMKRWLEKNRIKPHIKADAINVFNQFRKQISKPLRLCRHSDAIKFVEYLSSLGLADATVGKKISF